MLSSERKVGGLDEPELSSIYKGQYLAIDGEVEIWRPFLERSK